MAQQSSRPFSRILATSASWNLFCITLAKQEKKRASHEDRVILSEAVPIKLLIEVGRILMRVASIRGEIFKDYPP